MGKFVSLLTVIFVALFVGSISYAVSGKKCKIDSENILKMKDKAEIHAIISTNHGDIKLKLFHKLTPNTVANFVGLAEGTLAFIDHKTGKKTTRPFYKDLSFHRVVKGFMIQGGCPKGDGTGGTGCTFNDEFKTELRHNKKGILSMANSGPNSNSSQFFITVKPTEWLDDKHTVFGEVIEGYEIVEKISQIPILPGSRPAKKVFIKNINIERLKKEQK